MSQVKVLSRFTEVLTENPAETFMRGRRFGDSIFPGDQLPGSNGSGFDDAESSIDDALDGFSDSSGFGDRNDSDDSGGSGAFGFALGLGSIVVLLSVVAFAFGQLFDIEV